MLSHEENTDKIFYAPPSPPAGVLLLREDESIHLGEKGGKERRIANDAVSLHTGMLPRRREGVRRPRDALSLRGTQGMSSLLSTQQHVHESRRPQARVVVGLDGGRGGRPRHDGICV